jgi:hypothetical protein
MLKFYLHRKHFLIKVETKYTELSSVKARVFQGSVLRLLLYLLYTADLPTSPESITVTFANDTAVLTTDSDKPLHHTSCKPTYLHCKTRLKLENESQVDPRHTHYAKRNVPLGPYKHVYLSQEDVKYLRLHLDRRLTRHKHIFVKRKQQGITLAKMYWTQIKTLYKQQTSHVYNNIQTNLDLRNTILGYGFRFQQRHSRTFAIKNIEHNSGNTLEYAECSYTKLSPIRSR